MKQQIAVIINPNNPNVPKRSSSKSNPSSKKRTLKTKLDKVRLRFLKKVNVRTSQVVQSVNLVQSDSTVGNTKEHSLALAVVDNATGCQVSTILSTQVILLTAKAEHTTLKMKKPVGSEPSLA